MIKINIFWNIEELGGGGNQFLKNLRKYFVNCGVYQEDPKKADVLLVNSKDRLLEAADFKKKHSKLCVHRIDGIFKLYRGEHEYFNDLKVYEFSKNTADGVVYQSKWSKDESKQNGMSSHDLETIIYNCADDSFFNTDGINRNGSKIQLITSTWSLNPKKGFKFYGFLDDSLNLDKYKYVFVGRSNLKFKHFDMKGVLSSEDLAKEFKKSHIFITGTEDDTCSNCILESQACGLPVIAYKSGGNPEIVSGGEVFVDFNDLHEKIEKVANNLDFYRSNIQVNKMADIGKQYLDFAERVYCEKH